MDIQRETVVQAGVSFAAVFVFIGAVVYVGTSFRANGTITPDGGLAILGAIVLFMVVMSAVGYWLAGQGS